VSLFGKCFDLSIHLPYVIFTIFHHFDLIHAHYGYLRFLKAKIRIVHFHADPFYHGSSQNKSLNLQNNDFRNIADLSDAQIAVSNFITGQVMRGLQDRAKVYTIKNGVDIDHFNVNNHQDISPFNANRFRQMGREILVLYVGAFSEEKGVIYLADAFFNIAEKYPQINLILAGTSNLWANQSKNVKYAEYEGLVFNRLNHYVSNNRVHFLGKVGSNNLPALYQACDFLVVPSIYPEAFGLVALEALACGKPVIASKVGGLPEVINNENGILVEPGNQKELENAIVKLALDPSLRFMFGESGRKFAEQLSWEKAVNKIEEVYCLVKDKQ
jgi:glycosyltransferase involved in cell wall biosynthesis